MKKENCTHAHQIKKVTPQSDNCAKCAVLGDTWVHLRLCLICGHVGCCDSSKNKHATAHFHETDHAIMQSFQSEEKWLWCYVDKDYLE